MNSLYKWRRVFGFIHTHHFLFHRPSSPYVAFNSISLWIQGRVQTLIRSPTFSTSNLHNIMNTPPVWVKSSSIVFISSINNGRTFMPISISWVRNRCFHVRILLLHIHNGHSLILLPLNLLLPLMLLFQRFSSSYLHIHMDIHVVLLLWIIWCFVLCFSFFFTSSYGVPPL